MELPAWLPKWLRKRIRKKAIPGVIPLFWDWIKWGWRRAHEAVSAGGDLDFLGLWDPMVSFVKEWDGVIVPLLGVAWLWWIGKSSDDQDDSSTDLDLTTGELNATRAALEEAERQLKERDEELNGFRAQCKGLGERLADVANESGRLRRSWALCLIRGHGMESSKQTVSIHYDDPRDHALAVGIYKLFTPDGSDMSPWRCAKPIHEIGQSNPSTDHRVIFFSDFDSARRLVGTINAHGMLKEIATELVARREALDGQEVDIKIMVFHQPALSD